MNLKFIAIALIIIGTVLLVSGVNTWFITPITTRTEAIALVCVGTISLIIGSSQIYRYK